MQRDNRLYGVGSRDIPVVLGHHQTNSDLRIIHELFHSRTIGSNRLQVNPPAENATPAYNSLGESTSGCYFMNPHHAAYPEFMSQMLKATQATNMNGFATDYFTAIEASRLGGVATGYVRAITNPVPEKDEGVEKGRICNMIRQQTSHLSFTSTGKSLLLTLNKPETIERIADFYDRDQVIFVRDLMLGTA